MEKLINKKYNISLHFGNTQKTIMEMDIIDVYYGLSEEDKNALLWGFIDGLHDKTLRIQAKNNI